MFVVKSIFIQINSLGYGSFNNLQFKLYLLHFVCIELCHYEVKLKSLQKIFLADKCKDQIWVFKITNSNKVTQLLNKNHTHQTK